MGIGKFALLHVEMSFHLLIANKFENKVGMPPTYGCNVILGKIPLYILSHRSLFKQDRSFDTRFLM